MEENSLVYYFAFGSNLDPERMKKRGAVFTERKLGKLENYEFVLNYEIGDGTAAANIRYKPGSVVYGALYKCTPESINKLQGYEVNYRQIKVDIYTEENVCIKATLFLANEDAVNDNINAVADFYLNHILCGKDILPPDYYSFLETFLSITVPISPSEKYSY